MLRKIGLLALTSMAVAQQPAPYRPVATNLQIMRAMVIPASDAIFSADASTEQEWVALENQALILAESGNLLMMGDRSREGVWIKESRALVDAGAAAFDAAHAHDTDRLLAIGEDVLSTCSGCHQKYPNR